MFAAFLRLLCARPVEWRCLGYSLSINANDSNLIQYHVYLNRILKLALIVSGAIALLVYNTYLHSSSILLFENSERIHSKRLLFFHIALTLSLSLSSHPIWHNRMAELLRPYLVIYIIRQLGLNSIALIARSVHKCPSRERKFYKTKALKIIPISIYFL